MAAGNQSLVLWKSRGSAALLLSLQPVKLTGELVVWGTEFIIHICISDAERKSLYTLFLESIQLRLQHGEDSTTHILNEEQATKENLIKMQSIAERHLELDDIHDPLLAINFAR